MHTKDVTVIAITGGPCGGKTSFMARARQFLEDHGFRAIVIPESATELLTSGFDGNPAEWRHPMDFQELVYRLCTAREKLYQAFVLRLKDTRPVVFLEDRGKLDGIAYAGRKAFQKMIWDVSDMTIPRLMDRYAAALHFVTAAIGAEAYYTLANNAARSETPERARELDTLTHAAWHGHPHLVYVDNRTDFEGKILRGLQGLARVLGIPEPLEKERRFWLKAYDPSIIPANAVAVEIEQHYLRSSHDAARRVRRRTLDGVSSHYYTEKRATKDAGIRHEIERMITENEYLDLLHDPEPFTVPVKKMRHCFVHAGHYVELDVFIEPARVAGIAVAEVEVSDLREDVDLPKSWKPFEVTRLPDYSNYDIAMGSSSFNK